MVLIQHEMFPRAQEPAADGERLRLRRRLPDGTVSVRLSTGQVFEARQGGAKVADAGRIWPAEDWLRIQRGRVPGVTFTAIIEDLGGAREEVFR